MVSPGSPAIAIPFGTILAGDLRVFESLGATPEGPLYQAEYPDGRRVALLLLQATGTHDRRPRWERFSRATQIQHPNVAAVYAVGHMEDGSPYAVLEQLNGEPLVGSLAAGHAAAQGEALDIAVQSAAGLRAAHRAGFIHGNLSARTVLVTRPPYGKPQVKLIGFQLDPGARHVTLPTDEASLECASPERLSGSLLDERSDVYSLGALLRRLLTGTTPAPGGGLRGVPRAVRPVLARALAQAPDQRYQTMAELHEALERLTATGARPRRSRAFLFRAAAVGLVLVTAGVWLRGSSSRPESGAERPVPSQARPADTSRSPARARPAARQEAQRSDIRAGGRDPSPVSDGRQRRVTRPQGTPARDREADGIRPEGSDRTAVADQVAGKTASADGSAAPGGNSRNPGSPRATAAPDTVALDRQGGRQVEEPDEAAEPLGYVADRALASGPTLPPNSGTGPPAVRPPRPTAPRGVSPDARARHELDQHQGLRLAIEDVLRIGVGEDVAEIRPGVLVVSLAPGGMNVPSATYNLQRLYLAYSAATRQQPDIVLELRHDGEVYARLTRQGLIPPASD